ncbi:MAG: glycoside hydrolase family 9 protein [Prevotella sp.]|nr:glycoside hydrolase family 9 protein [Prevotella sp.]
MNCLRQVIIGCAFIASTTAVSGQTFQLNDRGYFNAGGVDVMAFDDIYPEGHQAGVSILMNGNRLMTNGDIRLEATPGQWQPLPKQLKRETGTDFIATTLQYPDSSRHLTGFNPMIYPDLQLRYQVKVKSMGDYLEVTVDLDCPIPDKYIGKVGFNMEIFPGFAFGKPWIMDDQTGIYPRQPNSPLAFTKPNQQRGVGNYHDGKHPLVDISHLTGKGYNPIVADDIIALPYAEGKCFTTFVDDPKSQITIESLTGELKLYDGRMNHNNGWFVLRSEIAAGATEGAVRWIIRPNVVKDWQSDPVVQTSQVGYHPLQKKTAVIELDMRSSVDHTPRLVRMEANGARTIKDLPTKTWGKFLRYQYLTADFSDVQQPGLYQVVYGKYKSPLFRIDTDVYDRGVWQPVVEYFLPVQMCHMRVAEKYRVWHDACHMDDATMAQPHNLFDGYDQRPDAYGKRYKAGKQVDGVNIGGWHDAGDFDLRIESQAGESYILTLAYEEFNPELDVTSVNHATRVTEIHQPDGKNDVLQQVENGALSVVNSYLSLGRLYRGIICNNLRQYVLLGDAAAMTDGQRGNEDDRWIFTENNTGREMQTAAQLAAISRAMKGFNDTLSVNSLNIAKEIFETQTAGKDANPRLLSSRLHAAVELFLTTGEKKYTDYVLARQQAALQNINLSAWFICRGAERWRQMKDKKVQGFPRADWSYIPGGVVSGTALIRPDFPELLEFPFLWQQTEYCLGGASSHYMFIALAAQQQWK